MRSSSARAITLVIAAFAVAASVNAQADDRKFEAGGQFSIMRFSIPSDGVPTPTGNDSTTDYGFGGRFGYNFNRNIGIEAEANFFLNDRALEGGKKSQFLAGLKAGTRSDKFGFYAKGRPGFLYLNEGDYQPTGACAAIFPAPFGCFSPKSTTNFAVDVGGIVEYYPTTNTIVRFDAGDTIVRYGRRGVPTFTAGPGPTILTVLQVPSETTHNFQMSIGFGFRF